MEKTALELIATLAVKSLNELTAEDIAFLKARRDYLNGDQKEKFKSILSDVPPVVETDKEDGDSEDTETPEKPKKGRKKKTEV